MKVASSICSHNYRIIYNSLLLGFYMLFCFGAELSATQAIHSIFKVLVLFFSFLPIVYDRECKFNPIAFILFVIVSIMDTIKGNLSSVNLYVLCSPLLACFVIKNKFSLKVLYGVFIIISGILLLAEFRGAAEDVLVNSRNFVSVTILFNTALLLFIKYRQDSVIVLWPAIIAFVICLLAVGRGGILTSSILLLGLSIIKLHVNSSRRKKIIIYVCIIGFIALFSSSLLAYYEASDNLERIRNRGMHDYSRERIIEAYLDHMDASTFLFGYDITKDPTIQYFNGNPHNSYIRLHSHMGVFLLVPLYMVILSVVYFFIRKNYFSILCLMVLLLRCFSDMVLLNHYDFVLLLYLLEPYYDKNK